LSDRYLLDKKIKKALPLICQSYSKAKGPGLVSHNHVFLSCITRKFCPGRQAGFWVFLWSWVIGQSIVARLQKMLMVFWGSDIFKIV